MVEGVWWRVCSGGCVVVCVVEGVCGGGCVVEGVCGYLPVIQDGLFKGGEV